MSAMRTNETTEIPTHIVCIMVWRNLQDKRCVFDRYLLAYLPTQVVILMFRSTLAQETSNSGLDTTGITTLSVLFELRAAVTVL